eukprot:6559258-Lingulodinium_polyedra.AAC.1
MGQAANKGPSHLGGLPAAEVKADPSRPSHRFPPVVRVDQHPPHLQGHRPRRAGPSLWCPGEVGRSVSKVLLSLLHV